MIQLSTWMMDYWISFTVTLDPNDGKGLKRTYDSLLLEEVELIVTLGPQWKQYTTKQQVCHHKCM
jgi:hypothetical protein